MNGHDADRIDTALPRGEGERPASPGGRGHLYEIYVRGHLNSQWLDWLGGLEMKLLDNGEMILSGAIVDQAALMGILNKLADLNLALLSFREVTTERSEES